MRKFKAAPIAPGQFAVLLAVYHYPARSGLKVAEAAGLDKRCGYMMITRLRRLGLIRSQYDRRGQVTFAEHCTTAKGDRLLHAWFRFQHDVGRQLQRELNL